VFIRVERRGKKRLKIDYRILTLKSKGEEEKLVFKVVKMNRYNRLLLCSSCTRLSL